MPSAPVSAYVIASGDSLSSVARHFGVTIEQLLAVNPSIEDSGTISIGQVISVPEVPWRPLVIESAARDGSFDSAARHLFPDQTVTVRVTADRSMAGDAVDWFVDWQAGSAIDWTSYGTDAVDSDGTDSISEALSEHGRVAWQARLAQTADHGELWSDPVIVEWGGTGPCPASESGRMWRAESPDGTVYEAIAGVDSEWNGQASIVASNLLGTPGKRWRHELGVCKRPLQIVFAGDGTAFVTILDVPWTAYALDAKVFVFGPDSSMPRAAIPTSGAYGSSGPSLLTSPDGTVYMFTFDGEYDLNTFRSLSLTAFDSSGHSISGWPYTSTDRGSDPVFGPDGTIYLALWDQGGDRVVALDRSGHMKPGWPFVLAAGSSVPSRAHTEAGDMAAVEVERPESPVINSDGTITVKAGDSVYTIEPDGTLQAG